MMRFFIRKTGELGYRHRPCDHAGAVNPRGEVFQIDKLNERMQRREADVAPTMIIKFRYSRRGKHIRSGNNRGHCITMSIKTTTMFRIFLREFPFIKVLVDLTIHPFPKRCRILTDKRYVVRVVKTRTK